MVPSVPPLQRIFASGRLFNYTVYQTLASPHTANTRIQRVSKRFLLLQLLLTLFILGFVESNGLKVFLLLPLWWISFGGLSKAEWVVFLLTNIVFVVSDLGAIRNGVFQFTQPDNNILAPGRYSKFLKP
jgi:hypothetical protein